MDRNKILIVDDDPVTCKMLKALLEKDNYATVTVEGVGDALGLLKENSEEYFLILSDYSMPEKTGIDLLRTVKKLYPMIELILITGAGSEGIAIQAMRLGVMDYIKKPINTEELLSIVKKAHDLNQLRLHNVEYFDKILKLKNGDEIEVESFKIFIKGMEEELLEGYSYIRKAYFFLKKLDSSLIKPELKKEFEALISESPKTSSKLKKKNT